MSLSQGEKNIWDEQITGLPDPMEYDQPVSLVMRNIPVSPFHVELAILDNHNRRIIDDATAERACRFVEDLKKLPDFRCVIAEFPLEGHGLDHLVTLVFPESSDNEQA